jgi:ATP-dependent DNA ligase
MIYTYGDKPLRDFKTNIAHYSDGNWFFSTKADGWRTRIVRDKSQRIISPFGQSSWARGRDKSLFFLSSRDMKKGGPTQIPVSEEIVKSVEALDLADLSLLDTEWMARRTIGECLEKLFVIDVAVLADKSFADETYYQRKNIREELLVGKLTSCLDALEETSVNLQEFYDKMTTIPWTEGMVGKHKNSKLKASSFTSVDNPLWVKIKWRDGSSGRDTYQSI